MLHALQKALQGAWSLLSQRQCAMCDRPLLYGSICPSCWMSLPYTHLRGVEGNMLEQVFWEYPQVDRVSAFLWYKPEYQVSKLVHSFKYGQREDLGIELGEAMAEELRGSRFFDQIDALLPVPLSQKRQRQRGYNQSLALAKGVNKSTHLPIITNALYRTIDNPSQTQLEPLQRRSNVAGIFTLKAPELLHGQHLLLIDDVITVGATLESIIQTFIRVMPNIRLSILCLCAAGHYHHGAISPRSLYPSSLFIPAPPISPPTSDISSHARNLGCFPPLNKVDGYVK